MSAMPLDIFFGLDADLLDVADLADMHRKIGLELVMGTRREGAPCPVPVIVDGELLPAEAAAIELLRLAAVGRYALTEAATHPLRSIQYVMRSAQQADRQLCLRAGVFETTIPEQPPGPP